MHPASINSSTLGHEKITCRSCWQQTLAAPSLTCVSTMQCVSPTTGSLLAKVKSGRPARRRAIQSTYRSMRKGNLTSFESALQQSSQAPSSANTADTYADRMAEVIASDLNKIASVKKCTRRSPRPLTKVALNRSCRCGTSASSTGEAEEITTASNTGDAVVQQTG